MPIGNFFADKADQSKISQIKDFFYQIKIPLLSMVLVLVSLSFSLAVTQNNASFEKGAVSSSTSGKLICQPEGGMGNKYNSNTLVVTNNKNLPVAIWIQDNICDYYGTMPREGYQCNNYLRRYNDTINPGETKRYLVEVADCKIGQIDINTIIDSGGGCYTPDGDRWSGGMAFATLAVPNGYPDCPIITLSPTPSLFVTPSVTLTPIPTPTIAMPSCRNLQILGDRVSNRGSDTVRASVGYPVRISADVKQFGILYVAKVNSAGQRVNQGSVINLERGSYPEAYDQIGGTFTPRETGYYAVEVNAFDSSDCRYLCTGGSSLYKDNLNMGYNGCRSSTAHWDLVGGCQSTCIKWINVVDDIIITPTATPTVTPGPLNIQGRIYRDSDKENKNGRGGTAALIPPTDPTAWTSGSGGDLAALAIDIEIVPDGAGGVQHLYDIANHPNTIDVCSSLSKQERNYPCGEGASHCSTYGGFSFNIPVNAKIYNLGNENFYHIILNSKVSGWKISEAYWMDSSSTVLVPAAPAVLPVTIPTEDERVTRCDYWTEAAKQAGDRTQANCNTCTKGVLEFTRICMNFAFPCNINSFSPSATAHVLVPVNGADTRSLWIGVYPESTGTSGGQGSAWWQKWLQFLGF